MREVARNSRTWRERAIARGECPRCGKPKSDTDKGWSCFDCRRYKAAWMKQRYRSKKDG